MSHTVRSTGCVNFSRLYLTDSTAAADVYEKRISENDWLSEDTKKKAIVKLRALILKIGYPEKIEEIYDRLQVVPVAEGGSLYSNESAAAI